MIRVWRQVKGFTLIEVLLILAILGLIGGLAIPFYQSFQVTSELENTTKEITQTIRRAQITAMSSEGLSDHGIHFAGQQYILFRGAIYNPADIYNESFDLSPSLSVSTGGNDDIIFSSVSGLPNVEATITINTNNGRSNSITINGLGVPNVN
ncbi:MAG: prepilin-type N-terminal cleavage/methylation domain-containing protein [Candidatus Kerfeldbacteria bacterium]|jgi:type II secretory pathway pseudopilin PulG